MTTTARMPVSSVLLIKITKTKMENDFTSEHSWDEARDSIEHEDMRADERRTIEQRFNYE